VHYEEKTKRAWVIAAQIILESNLAVCGQLENNKKSQLKVIYCNQQAGVSGAALGTLYAPTDKMKAGALFENDLMMWRCLTTER